MSLQVVAQAADPAVPTLGYGIIVVLALGYVASLYLHPYRACRVCKGSPRLYGSIYNFAFRRCRRCDATGRTRRAGTYVFGPRKPY